MTDDFALVYQFYTICNAHCLARLLYPIARGTCMIRMIIYLPSNVDYFALPALVKLKI
jgi:hypothetical protein